MRRSHNLDLSCSWTDKIRIGVAVPHTNIQHFLLFCHSYPLGRQHVQRNSWWHLCVIQGGLHKRTSSPLEIQWKSVNIVLITLDILWGGAIIYICLAVRQTRVESSGSATPQHSEFSTSLPFLSSKEAACLQEFVMAYVCNTRWPA